MAQPRAPPDVSAADSVRPRVCLVDRKAIDDTRRSKSTVKLSRPQKRRRRLEILAGCRALANRDSSKVEEISSAATFQSKVLTFLENIDTRLAKLEVARVHSVTDFGTQQYEAYASQSWEPFLDGEAVLQNLQRPEAFTFNANAPEFKHNLDEPISERKEFKLGDFRCLPAAAWKVFYRPFETLEIPTKDMETQDCTCNRCGEKAADCCCEDIICSGCFASAIDCICQTPELRSSECLSCAHVHTFPSLHGDVLLSIPWRHPQFCIECGSDKLQPGGLNFITPSEHRCGLCTRRDGQRLIQECDNQNCTSESLFHRCCMTRHFSSGVELFLCDRCVETGNIVCGVDAADSESQSEHAENFDAPKLSDCTGSSNGGGGFWNDRETMIWAQVTMRMAHSCADQASYHQHLRERWKDAQVHVNPAQRDSLKRILEEECKVSLD